MLFLLLNGLLFWKNPLFFFIIFLSLSEDGEAGGSCLTGELIPLGGSLLENDVGAE
jgi:hypothetical protein